MTKVQFLLGKLEKPPKTCALISFAFFSEIQHVRDSKYGFVLQEGIPSAYWKVCISVCSHYIICTIMLLLILLQVIFLFLLFLGMVMYASEVETTAKKKQNNKIT